MDVVESLRMGWRSIRGHPLRSTLTTLGVIIGVAAVIIFVTLGTSLQAEIIGDVAGQQEPAMSVWAGPEGTQGGPGAGAQPVFTEGDVAAIDAIESVNATLQQGSVGPATLTRGRDTISWSQLAVVPPDYFEGVAFTNGSAYANGEPAIVINRAAAGLFEANGSLAGAVGGGGTSDATSVPRNDTGGESLENLSIRELRNLSANELRNATDGNESIATILQQIETTPNETRITTDTTNSSDTTNGTSVTDTASTTVVGTNTTLVRANTTVVGTNTTLAGTNASNASSANLSVGEEVVIDLDGRSITATVAGITNSTPVGPFNAGFGGSSPQFYVPPEPFYNTTVALSGGERERVYPLVSVTATGFDRVDSTRDRVQAYLDNDSDARALVPDSYVFNVRTNEQLLDQLQEIIGTLTDFIVAIAAISLLVGSIGIANIMLVSVTERTREIGIMKATGARRRDVLQVFIVEAVLLGVIGSMLGAGLGALGGYALTQYVELPLVLDPWLFAGAIGVGIGVGVLAGVYPAWRAARTDPIDALRYE